MRIEELDVVKLKDGREATILEVFADPTAYLVDAPVKDEWEQIFVKPDEIDQIVWKAKAHKIA